MMEQSEPWLDAACQQEGIYLQTNSKKRALVEKLKFPFYHGICSTRHCVHYR